MFFQIGWWVAGVRKIILPKKTVGYLFHFVFFVFAVFPSGSTKGTGEDHFSFSVCNRGPTAAQYHPSKFVADGLYGTFDEMFF